MCNFLILLFKIFRKAMFFCPKNKEEDLAEFYNLPITKVMIHLLEIGYIEEIQNGGKNMKCRIYTDEELKLLNKNIFVKEVKYKREISYETVFKLWCVMMRIDNPEFSAREIFEYGGFDTNILHKRLPQGRINDWLDNYNKFGVNYFLSNDGYHTIKPIKKTFEETNFFFEKLLSYVLNRLKEIENDR